MIIVSFIAGAFSTLRVINPTYDEYEEAYDNYYNYISEMAMKGNSNEIFNDVEANEMSYDLSYYGRYSSIIGAVVLIGYFGLFQYFTGGKTVGKLALRIQVKSRKGKLKFYQILLRSALINSIFTKVLTILCLFLMSKSLFIKYCVYIQVLDIAILLVSVIMIMYRKDGLGLHDFIANTEVKRIEKTKEAAYIEV